jgi:hypothetical protein
MFAASLSSPDKRLFVAGEIAKILGVTDRSETMQPTNKLTVQAWVIFFKYIFALYLFVYHVINDSPFFPLIHRLGILSCKLVELYCIAATNQLMNIVLFGTYSFIKLSLVC